MSKKSQITIIIIVSIVIIVVLGFLFVKSNIKKTSIIKGQREETSFSGVKDSLYYFTSNCLKELSDEAVDRYHVKCLLQDENFKGCSPTAEGPIRLTFEIKNKERYFDLN